MCTDYHTMGETCVQKTGGVALPWGEHKFVCIFSVCCGSVQPTAPITRIGL